jgi:fatty acid desaturase
MPNLIQDEVTESRKKSSKTPKRRKKSSPLFQDSNVKTIREQKAPELSKINVGTEASIIFSLSLFTAIILILLGFSLFLLAFTTFSILVGLAIIVIGVVQLIVDFGWVAMIKANHVSSIETWIEAFYSVAKVRGQKIFVLPILVDIVLILVAVSSIFFFE